MLQTEAFQWSISWTFRLEILAIKLRCKVRLYGFTKQNLYMTWSKKNTTQCHLSKISTLLKKKKKIRLDKICLRWSLQIRRLNCCLTQLSFECRLGNCKVHLITPWSTVTNYHSFFFLSNYPKTEAALGVSDLYIKYFVL